MTDKKVKPRIRYQTEKRSQGWKDVHQKPKPETENKEKKDQK